MSVWRSPTSYNVAEKIDRNDSGNGAETLCGEPPMRKDFAIAIEQHHNSKLTTFRSFMQRRALKAIKTSGASVVTLDNSPSADEHKRVIDEFVQDLGLLTRIVGC
jgi:hypothetical protein